MLQETRERFLRLVKAAGLIEGEIPQSVHEENDAMLASTLVNNHGCDKKLILQILCEVFKLPAVDIAVEELERSFLKLATDEFWQRSLSMPMREEDGQMLLVMADPEDLLIVDELTALVGKPTRILVGLASDIKGYLRDWGGGLKVDSLVSDLIHPVNTGPRLKTTTDSEAGSPAVWLIDSILGEAVTRGVKEVYFIPFPEGEAHVRFKLDTKIIERKTYPLALHKKVVGRLRVQSDLLGKATREPQNGSYLVQIQDDTYEVDVMIMPADAGDAVTLFLKKFSGKQQPKI